MTWEPTDAIRLRFGSYYSLFKYDLFVVEEREDATTFFLRARWKVNEKFRLDGRYEYETGDDGDYHALIIGLTWTF